MIYWKVSACESGKCCFTTDFTNTRPSVVVLVVLVVLVVVVVLL